MEASRPGISLHHLEEFPIRCSRGHGGKGEVHGFKGIAGDNLSLTIHTDWCMLLAHRRREQRT